MSVAERLGYWERGAAVLRAFGYPDAYGCPLCLRLFRRDQIDQCCLGHALPKSLGGKLQVLVCTECEQPSGHELDAHAHRFDVFRRIVTGEPYPSVPARLQFEAVTVNVELQSDGALNEIRVPPNKNPPGVPEKFAAAFQEKAGSGSVINFDLPRLTVPAQRVRISYLRAGYLAAFAVFGYSVIAQRSFDRVRQQIREPDIRHLPQFFYEHDDLCGYEVWVVEEPAWHSSIIVLMGEFRITLPHEDDGEIYERIAERAAVGGHWTMRCVRRGWPSWPRYPMYFSDLGLSRAGKVGTDGPKA